MQYLVLWSSLLSFLVLVVFSEAGDISRHKINAEYDSYQSDIQNTENESKIKIIILQPMQYFSHFPIYHGS